MIVLANGHKAQTLEDQRSALESYEYHLYVNNLTPDGDDAVGDFTECTDSGYAGTGPQPPVYSGAFLNGDDQGEFAGDPLVWTFSHAGGDFTVYGYYATDPGDADSLVYSERAATPFVCTAASQTYTVYPRYLHDTLA